MAYDVELADRLRAALSYLSGVSEKKMFGGLAFLVNGHLTVAASGRGGLLLRVGRESHEELLAEPDAIEVDMGGRRMTGWLHVLIDASADEDTFQRWLQHALRFVRTLD